jgi:hypothetical protein
VALLRPLAPPYDPLAWARLPLPERARLACEAWALEGYGTPLAIPLLYAVKLALFAGAWVLWCRATPGLGEWGRSEAYGAWWLHPIAFEKAILWSMLFESLGLGCGSGPLSGRYAPPVGGALYFLRPGTTKAPLARGLPGLGGSRRTALDVALYAALLALLVRALLAADPGPAHYAPIALLVPVLALADRAVALATRPEHYWTTIVVLAATPAWIGGAKAIFLALWLWAGISKLGHHFPTVVCVMTSNSPCAPRALRRRMYRAYPHDLRPSRLAVALAHAGTALELGVPIVLALATRDPALAVGLGMAIYLHAFIASNAPAGVPIEWNLVMVYGAFALFYAHPDVPPLAGAPPLLLAFLAAMLIGLPLVGNLAPARVSFLLAMRFYAGNWPYGAWLFRGDSYRKLDRLVKPAPGIYDQLARFFDRSTAVGLAGRVLAFRLMHLQGRALPALIPRALAAPPGGELADYDYHDGELVGGLVLGWNFGDGHLHDERLLAAIQQQCGFAPGELRCIFVEGQPLGRPHLAFRIYDACTGLLEAGRLDVRELRARQPWASAASAAPPATRARSTQAAP